ncbi:MAG: OmpA family protein [Deltaproteobacteria bacterium]|nr:OmpA family protein [Deltaproteobacteria bacterium]
MKRPSRLSLLTAGAALGAAGITAVPSAHANVEVGITAGVHKFNETNELGVPDATGAVTPTSLSNSALFGLRLGYYFNTMLGVEVEGGVIPSETRGSPVVDAWTATYRAHLIAQFRSADPTNKLVPFVTIGGAAFSLFKTANSSVIDKDTDVAAYGGVGFKWRVQNGWGLRVDGRLMFPPSSADSGVTTDWEGLLSVYKEFGRTAAKPVEKPIPKGPEDTDGDGINDDTDKCVNDAEDKDGFEDEDGCPDPDNDKDGVLDAADKCPTEAEDADGFQDEDGCPDPDNDNDGLPDAADKCPTDAEDKDGFEDEDGCPDPDNDKDGVLDAADKCGDQPETKNGFQDDDGCPDEVPKAVQKFTGAIKGINFKTGSAELLKTSNGTLDAAIKILKDYPDLKLEVQGHTDNAPLGKGSKFADNTALSQARADSVKAYFVTAGIADDRVVAKGYGDTVPVADNKTAAGKAKNRRVEFKLISQLGE